MTVKKNWEKAEGDGQMDPFDRGMLLGVGAIFVGLMVEAPVIGVATAYGLYYGGRQWWKHHLREEEKARKAAGEQPGGGE